MFYAHLEQKVGLCNAVQTAVKHGRPPGRRPLPDCRAWASPGTAGYQYPADDIPSFTLGSINVSPMSMAAAYATVAARGIYCRPVAITRS